MGEAEELYARVADLITVEEFEERIQKLIEGYDGLVNQRAAALLVVDELGRSQEAEESISDIRDGEDVTVEGEVLEISDVRTFRRRDGRTGRVRNIGISDGTGKCRIVLWDKDAEMVEEESITVGCMVRIINGRVKDGRYGLEVNFRYSSILLKDPR